MHLERTMSICIMAAFWEPVEALRLGSVLLKPLEELGKGFRYRFLHVRMKCSLKLCSNRGYNMMVKQKMQVSLTSITT